MAEPTEHAIRVFHEDRALPGFLALPAGEGPFPGVVVVHDITGLRNDTRRHCRNFAAAGFAAIAPDLYDGWSPGCVVRALARLASGNPAPELESFRAHLAARNDIDESRIGVTGFCMGGGFALLAAADGPYAVAGPFYGDVPREAGRLEGLCPTIAQAGSQDLVFRAAARRLEAHLVTLGVEGEVHVHTGVGHSFMNDHRDPLWPIARYLPLRAFHDPPTEQRAWELLLRFFDKHLR